MGCGCGGSEAFMAGIEPAAPIEASLYPNTYRAIVRAITPPGMGFVQALAAAATAAATVYATVKGTKGPKQPKDPAAEAAAIAPLVQAKLAEQGVIVNGGQAQDIAAAGLLDAFGPQNRQLVMIGGGVLGLALLVKLLKR